MDSGGLAQLMLNNLKRGYFRQIIYAHSFSHCNKRCLGATFKVTLDSKHDLAIDDVLKLSYITIVTILLLGHDERALVEDFLW